ncbi:MarR family transcriptional regulator [Aurantimonas aggregata]|uniref:MarR family transcriptional regulator n=1 Tax=Aurantimonas aggregata TaxID=2047720 RepID=A0A6L9MDK9_9HYPH|nr:MarR family transcriptional regulator [Aurantimonas aggregata]NDV85761.1 MarR family transcriptional regulator [Aurantimonas aggregata]
MRRAYLRGMNIALDQTTLPGQQRLAAASRLIERMGDHLEAEGMPRIAGRIFGLMIIEPDLVSFGALAERLEVSRASISTNARLLEDKGLLARVRVPGQRQDFYRLADQPYVNMLRGVAARMSETLATLATAHDDLPPEAGVERARLEQARIFFETTLASLTELSAQLSSLDAGGRDKS